MASKPGPFSEWPWQKLGNFKYVILAPWIASSIYSYMKRGEERNLAEFLVFPFLLLRWLHNQIWISVSRFQTARSKHRIVDKGIGFEQVDRESNWDDQILFLGLVGYTLTGVIQQTKQLPMWRSDGIVLTVLLHAGPVEFLYYWFHRALHHHYLYTRYHSHHHSSIATEPITSVVHPFAELVSYFALFSIPLLTTIFTRTASIASVYGYVVYIDFMNNMGHCNFEIVPKFVFRLFPPLKYLMYTPSFHSLHHTQFRTNYSLFMPIYDYIYGTVDKSSDALYESSIKGHEQIPRVVHLTHPMSLQSIYHLRLGISWVASKPYSSNFFVWMMCPITWGAMLLLWVSRSSFTSERIRFKNLTMQTWAIPRYAFQYKLRGQRASIDRMIENAILDAEKQGVMVISLGLLNQGQELNKYGEIYLQRHPSLRIRIVDGSGLVVATVINSIPQGTKRLLMRGTLDKIGYNVAIAACKRGIQVVMLCYEEYEVLKSQFPENLQSNLRYYTDWGIKVWLVGDDLKEEEQKMADKGTRFIPFSQFPPNKVRSDCFYRTTPAMLVPCDFEDMHTCENWLPRMVMSAWRVSGIVHALEAWEEHECGDRLVDADKAWAAALRHGFQPLPPE